MAKKAKTKANRKHLERVKNLNCLACEVIGIYDSTPCDAHHTHGDNGLFGKASDEETIPLCKPHHQSGGYGVAYHATPRKVWEAKFGTQKEMLEKTRSSLGID